MPDTSKGKKWETLHSLWVGWTFTLGFFNWIAFLYIGLRAKQLKWILAGLLYSVPFIIEMFVLDTETRDSTLGNLTIALQLILAVVSIIHAFKVRKEYLLRLEVLQRARRTANREATLRRSIEAEYGIGAQEVITDRSMASTGLANPPGSAVASAPNREQGQTTTPPATAVPPSTTTAPQSRGDNTSKQVRPAPAEARPVTLPKIESGDELEYQISSSYPFPLAFGFRSLSSIVDVRDLYREQLRIAENILAFLGSVSLAILHEENREEAGIDPKEYWQSGISPGDWREIVARCSKVFASHEDSPLASAVRRLNVRSEKKGFGADVIALIRAKNDYKHDRGPTVLEDIANATGEVQERLKRCMEALAFFTEYPIRQVEDFNISRRGDDVVLKCLRYTGDHPSFAQEEVLFHKGLPRGDLYLDLGHQSWVPLFPFVVTMNCSHCKAKETYFIDMWDKRRGIAQMKSFERGHTMSNQEVSDALAEWERNV